MQNKPNGCFMLPPERAAITAFVAQLPVRKVGGIGKVTERMLAALGVRSCQDILDQRFARLALRIPSL